MTIMPITPEQLATGQVELQELPEWTVFRYPGGVSWFVVTHQGQWFTSYDTGKRYAMDSMFPTPVIVVKEI